jgi:hypothetical protein
MNASKSEIESLENWLSTRLGPLISHGEKVRELLRAADGTEKIIASATKMVTSEKAEGKELSPQQIAVWKALLPIVAEHGLLAVRGGEPSLEKDKPLNKEEAAAFLGFSVSKLGRCMKKKQVEYEKYGTGQTATVRFRRADLEKFAASRKVAGKKS